MYPSYHGEGWINNPEIHQHGNGMLRGSTQPKWEINQAKRAGIFNNSLSNNESCWKVTEKCYRESHWKREWDNTFSNWSRSIRNVLWRITPVEELVLILFYR